MVDTFNIPAILVGSLLGLLICVLVGTVVYNVCKRRKMFGDDKEPARPKVFPVSQKLVVSGLSTILLVGTKIKFIFEMLAQALK